MSIILFTRLAGKDEYGKYSLLLSMILFSLTFTSGGISQVMLMFNNRYSHTSEKLRYTKAIVISSLISGAVGVIIVCVSIGVAPKTTAVTLLISITIYLFFFAYRLKSTYLQVSNNPQEIVWNELLRSFMIMIVPILLFFFFGYLNNTMMLLGVSIACLCALLFRLRRDESMNLFKVPFLKGIDYKAYFIEYMKYSLPLSLWLAVAYLLNVSDRYFIAYFMNYEEVGVYSAVYDIVDKSFSLAFFPILMAAHPLIMNNWPKNKGDSMRVLQKSLKYEALVFPFVLLGIVIVSPILSKMLKIDRHLFLSIGLPVAAGSFLWQFSMLLHKPMELHGRTLLMLVFALLALLVNVVGNIVFIPRFGSIAAAYTTVAGACVYILLTGIFYLRTGVLSSSTKEESI